MMGDANPQRAFLHGRPLIPPEPLFLALVGGYLLGATTDQKLVMGLQCNMALRWFVGLNSRVEERLEMVVPATCAARPRDHQTIQAFAAVSNPRARSHAAGHCRPWMLM